MGVQGLFNFLEKATKPFHLSEFKGATVAIDAYCWLAKGSLETSNREQLTNYCLQYLQLLEYNEIRPILIFNGQNLPIIDPMKIDEKNKEKQICSSSSGSEQSVKDVFSSQNVNPEIAAALIKECHAFKIDCIVAPYEAAAQLAFFNLRGIAELVITEDPDLILYGCSKICLQLNVQGNGLLLNSDLICDAIKMKPDCHTFDKFKHMCILSGCDYIEPLQGMNLKKAHEFILLTQDTNPETFLDTIPKVLNLPNLEISQEYKMNFMIVDAIYRHQIIFDPFTKKLEPLFDPHIAGTNPEYCKNAGEIYDQDKAYQVALGNLHPATFEPLDNWDPKETGLTNKSIWGTGPYERSPPRNQQKDSFKEYFSNYKFETIEETDVDDLAIKAEEENRTNRKREFELNSQFSSQPRTLDLFMEKDYGASFPMSRCHPLPSFETIGKHPFPPSTRIIPQTRPSFTPVTTFPGFVPQTVMPGSIPQTVMPGSIPQTVMPGSIPQTVMPGSIPQTVMPGSIPQTVMPGSIPQTVMPGSARQPVMPGLVPQTVMPGFVHSTANPGQFQRTTMPRSIFSKIVPNSIPPEAMSSTDEPEKENQQQIRNDKDDEFVRQSSVIDCVESVFDAKISDQNNPASKETEN